MFVATDRRVAVVKTELTSFRNAISMLEELLRNTAPGPVDGPPASITVSGKRYFLSAGTKQFVEVAGPTPRLSALTAPFGS
jgi:hypothetical protein